MFRVLPKPLVLIAALMLMVLTLSACGDDDTSSSTATTAAGSTVASTAKASTGPSGTLRVASVAPTYPTLAPQDTSSDGTAFRTQTLESLVTIKATNDSVTYQPMLAESWKVEANRTTFNLRKGVQFQKGMGEMTCDDVLFSVNLEAADGTISAPLVTPNWKLYAAKFSCADPYTFVVDHNGGYGGDTLFDFSDWWYVQIQSKKYYDSVGPDQARKIIVGTGPFEMTALDANGMTLKAVPNHWRKTADFETINWKFISDDATRLSALQAGEVDVIDYPVALAPQVQRDNKLNVIRPTVQTGFAAGMFGGLVYSTNPSYDPNNPFMKKEVREALNIAINRKELVDKVLYGLATPMVNSPYFWPGAPGYIANLQQYPYDPAKAKDLLKQAGYPNGLTVKVIDAGPLRVGVTGKDFADALAAYWQPIGVKVDVLSMDSATLNSLRRSRDAKLNGAIILLNGDLKGYSAPNALYGSKAVATFGERQDFDALLTQYAQTKETSLNTKLNQTAWDDYQTIPLVFGSRLVVYNKSAIGSYPLSFPQGVQSLEYVTHK